MKKLLTILALSLSLTASAEIKTDTTTGVKYMDIAPVRLLSDTAARIAIPSFTDNNDNQAVAYVVLYSASGVRLTDFNVVIMGDYYAEWNGNEPESLYEIVADIKRLTLK